MLFKFFNKSELRCAFEGGQHLFVLLAGINLSTSNFGLQIIDFEPEIPHVCVGNFRRCSSSGTLDSSKASVGFYASNRWSHFASYTLQVYASFLCLLISFLTIGIKCIITYTFGL